MRKLMLVIAVMYSFFGFGQNINIPDVAFKNYLITYDLVDTDSDGFPDTDADVDNDGEISLNEALSVKSIRLGYGTSSNGSSTLNISNLEGLQFFTNLETLTLNDILATSIPVLSSSTLIYIKIQNNSVNSVELTNVPNLKFLTLLSVSLTNLDVTSNSNLEELFIDTVPLQNIVGISNKSLRSFIFNRTQLTSLTIDNVNDSIYSGLSSSSDVKEVSQNPLLNHIYINNSVLHSLDIHYNPALIDVNMGNSDINFTFNLSFNSLLDSINLTNSTIDWFWPADNPVLRNLNTLNIDFRQISSFRNNFYFVDFSNLQSLVQVKIMSDSLRELNLNNNPMLSNIEIIGNFQRLFLKNTTFYNFNLSLNQNNLNRYICVSDNFNNLLYVNNELQQDGITNVVINDYCSFTSGGVTSEINGNLVFDENDDGCDALDPAFDNLVLNATDGNVSGFISTDSDGDYIIPVSDGQHTITPNPENPTYWNFSPANVVVDFPTQASPFTQDFCVTANGTIEDLEVIVVPLEQARPGFDTDYKLVVKNKGNVTTSGTLTLDFEEDFMTLLTTNPNAGNTPSNQLSWSFSNLQPFQMEEYEFTMTLNTPTQATNPLNGGDILNFTGTVTGTGNDAMPADNVMVFDQTVVNSYDPNDKTCLEGETIDPADVGEYVHYMIRFENTGTASAVNIVVKDEIDLTQFDISTLIPPLGGSHDYFTRVRDNNVVEFIHENINLDFNDATNDGYVLFKIKTLNTLVAGDTFDNTAEIFFDFNFPIITNTETVTVMSTATIGESTDSSISVYPNPATDFINISSSNGLESATIIDVNGRMLSQTSFTGNATSQRVSLENLNSGIYFVTVKSDLGQKVEKLVVE